MNVHNISHDSQNLEATQMSINRRLDEQIAVKSRNRIRFSSKSNKPVLSNNADKSQKHYVEGKKQTQKNRHCVIPCIQRCLRKVYINGDRNQNSSHVWLGEWIYLGEGNGGFFRALEMFCILTGMWIIQVNMFAKTHHLRFVQDVVCKWYLGGTLCMCVY